VHISVFGLPRPMGFCNTYVGGAALAADFMSAASQIDAFNFGPVRITGVAVDVRLRRALRQAFMLKVTAPRTVRRGARVRLRLVAQRVNGPTLSRTISVRIPKDVLLGSRRLQLTGTAADAGGSLVDELTTVLNLDTLFGDDPEDDDGGTGPRTLKALARDIAAVHRYDGVNLSFPPLGGETPVDEDLEDPGAALVGPEAAALRGRPAYRDSELRFSGATRTTVRVVR